MAILNPELNFRVDARGHVLAVQVWEYAEFGGYDYWWYDLDGSLLSSGHSVPRPNWVLALRVDARGHVVNLLVREDGVWPPYWYDLDGYVVGSHIGIFRGLSAVRIDARGHILAVAVAGYEYIEWFDLDSQRIDEEVSVGEMGLGQ